MDRENATEGDHIKWTSTQRVCRITFLPKKPTLLLQRRVKQGQEPRGLTK